MKNSQPNFHYEICFPDFAPSPAIKVDIMHYLSKLERVFKRIISCHVAVRAPHLRHRTHMYHIHVRLEIPGEDIVVCREVERDFSHSVMHLAIRDAFQALRRQLQKRVQGMRYRKDERRLRRREKLGLV